MEQKKYFLTNLAKGGFILFFGILISKFLGYAYRVIIARLGADIYGELSLALAVFGILATISILGLDMGTLGYISTYLTNNQKLY